MEAFILTEQPEEVTEIAGQYVLKFRGKGKVSVSGRSRLVAHRGNEIVFNYAPGDGMVVITIKDTDPDGTGDYVRDISVMRSEHVPLYETGAIFNPGWLQRVADLRAVRFMGWMLTNGSPVTNWEGRPRIDDYTYTVRGVPVEVMVTLANEIGVDPWFNMPHLADDTYMRNFATYVRDHLHPRLVAYVEYSNELWNFLFPQTLWANDQAIARWGKDAADDAWMQFGGMRAAQVVDIWRDVFGAEAETRLQRVIATHTGWPGLEEGMLEAPLWLAESPSNIAPARHFDAYAVTGYFGHEMGTDDWAPKIKKWLAEDPGEATQKLTEALREGSVAELTDFLWPYHAKTADRYGLELIMYEGGTHVTGFENWTNDDELTAFFNQFNYSPEMAGLYALILDSWRQSGGTLFNAFVDVAKPSKWGSWGALRHLWDDNPRWDVLMRYNRQATGWDSRPEGTFANGVYRRGSRSCG